jgi:filamentous hemagglutinin family protein
MQADSHPPVSSSSSSFTRRRKSFALKALPAAAALLFSPPGWTVDIAGGAGLPQNGTVFSGTISPCVAGCVAGNQLTINQTSARAVLDWGSYNIDVGKTVQILQPSASAAMLNRITGDANPSQILGTLTANGTVMLMNPNGVMFGQNATVNVGSLIATTGNIDVNNFINTGGAQITGAAGSITNEGSITAQAAGLVALVAPSVTNQGSITATGGTIALAGSTAATVSLNGGLYEFAIPTGATGTSVSNTAGASLAGATLRLGVGDAANLLSGVINLEGVQQASNAIVVNGHAVVLKSALQAPNVSGNANRVDVHSGARIQDGVDIAAAGGTVNVGAGTFTGGITIAKALTLDGAGIGQTVVKAPSAASGDAVAIKASGVTVSDMSINDSFYGVHLRGTANNVTLDRVAFNNNQYSVRSGTGVTADNFRMLNSTITGGLIGVNILNGYDGSGGGNASFKNALFENVTVDGTSFKGFYLETADNLTMRNVTITNAGNVGDPNSHQFGAAIDVNLKYGANGSINFDNVTVKNSGSATSAAVVIKTRGIPGDGSDYTRAPASLQSVNITGGSIEDSGQTGIRFETLSNGSGGQPTVTISGTRFKNNRNNDGKDIVVDKTSVDARGAVFEGAADGFAIEDRVTHALDATGRGLVTWTDGNVYVTQDSGSLQRGVDAVVAGGTVNVGSGTHVQARTVTVDRSMTLAGSGQGATVIDSSGVSGYGINVTADDVSLRDFTLHGPSANAASSYGIKVAPTGGASARLHNFSISNVTSRGAGRAELDLNGVDGAVIDRVTADGAPVGNNSGSTQGAGIQLTDSANVTITNSTTRNNAWGGLALYQANRAYNQQMNNITVADTNNFTERNPVYLQDESASRDFGTLDIAGFDFAVRNASTAGSNNQYTWLQASQQNAFDFAVNVGSAASSYVQGWNGAQATQAFHVGTGNLLGGGTQAMSIATALGNAANGASINVGAGAFAENVVVNNPFNLFFSGTTLHSLTLTSGGAGSGIGGTVTADGAGGFKFGGAVNLLGDTTLTTQGADIAFTADIQNAGGVARALRLIAGSGATRGNVFLKTGGTQASALGQLDVAANAFTLEHTLWVKGYKIDALGDVSLSDSTLKAVDAASASTLSAGGDVTGSTTNVGKVEVIAGGDIIATIKGTDVVAKAEGSMNIVVEASSSAVFEAKGPSTISGSAPVVIIDAPSGSLSGNFGQVSNTGGGLVNVNGKPQTNQTLSSNAENNRVIPAGNSLGEEQGAQEPALQLADAGVLAVQGEQPVGRSKPSGAGEAIDNGQAVELDMSPGNDGEKEKD